jgi:hypothetical protein
MKCYLITSDQKINWSDNGKEIVSLFEKKKKFFSQAINFVRIHGNSGVTNREIQALWQAQLQMCPQPWSRPQILSFQRHSRKLPKDEIYTTKWQGDNSSWYSKFRKCTKITRRDQRNQYRTLPKTKVIRANHEIIFSKSCLQSIYGCNCNRQYVAKFSNFGWE